MLLVRHGRTTANASGVLAGWTPGVHLDDTGRAQAAALGQRLAAVPLAAVVTSPLERTRETAQQLLDARTDEVALRLDDRLGEAHYGQWTGRALKDLGKDPQWAVVQAHPSAAVFPGPDGEAMAAMAARAVAAVREHAEQAGDATIVVVSHGDVIKAVLADALGLHLDLFQRLQVDPASLSVVRYTRLRPFVERLNDTGGSVAALLPPAKRGRRRKPSSDAVVGGGAGAS